MKLLNSMLPEPKAEYDHSLFSELIRKLQSALATNVQTKSDADEEEAINFFLNY